MTNTLTRSKSAPKRALGKYDSDHIANQHSLEVILEKEQSDIENAEMVQVLIYDPTDPDINDSQLEALADATNIHLPFFR